MKKNQTSNTTKKRKSIEVSSAGAIAKERSEQAAQKSAAEFFSEHQQIAGFDNVSL